LLPLIPAIAEQHNRLHGTNISWRDFQSYRFNEAWGGSTEEAVADVNALLGFDHSHLEPIIGAQDVTRSLSRKYDLIVVTARDKKLTDTTLTWVEHHFPGIFSDVVLTGNPYASESYERKVDVCQKLGAFVLVDDSINHTTKCVEAGLGGILFGDYPWNQIDGELPTGITRVSNWQTIAQHLGIND